MKNGVSALPLRAEIVFTVCPFGQKLCLPSALLGRNCCLPFCPFGQTKIRVCLIVFPSCVRMMYRQSPARCAQMANETLGDPGLEPTELRDDLSD